MEYYKISEEFIKWAESDVEFLRKYIELQLKLINESKQIDSISSKI